MALLVAAILALASGALLLPWPWPDAFLQTHLVHGIDIAAPPERVFAYVTAPVNWPRWHPQSLAVSGVVARTPLPGEQTIEEFEIAGRRGHATWTSVAVEVPRRWQIAAKDETGGSARIAYTLTPIPSGTHFQRDIVYRGDNLTFALANALKIRAVMDADSADALRRLKRAVEALASGESARP